MKQYLIVDLQGDYIELASLNDIKRLLISEVREDTFNNYDERDVVEGNVKTLCSLASDDMTLKQMEEQLKFYYYKIIDLLQIQRDLEDIKCYFLDKNKHVENVCETIDMINKEVNKNEI